MKTVMKSSSYKSKHHTGAPQSSNNRCIIFSFQHIHEKYCITKCETKEQISFLEKDVDSWKDIGLNIFG